MKQNIRFRYLSLVFGILLMALGSVGAEGLPGVTNAQGLPQFTELVQKYRPAVVNISTTQKKEQRQYNNLPKHFGFPDFPEDSPFHDFFRRFFDEGEKRKFETHSLGSGFIISQDGYIISNNHVVKNADEIIVRLSDRREFGAKVVGVDEKSDIALLKVDAKGLPTVETGVSAKVDVGEWVLAIGSPFGFDHSVTAGIVSAKGRSLPSENYVPFIQTDVAINPGNSGGPLFNLEGKVIGVNAQIFSHSGGFMGLSFAIPIDVAMDVVKQLREQGRVSRGWLGVLIQDVTRELAESFGMERPTGALIAKVLPKSPAERAGLRVGDVVLQFDGREVRHSSDLPPIVGSTKVGSRKSVTILRDGKPRTIHVVIAELPEEEKPRLVDAGDPNPAVDDRLGLSTRDVTTEEREEYKLGKHGVLVEKVEEGPAREAGIRSGDIIVMVHAIKIKNVRHLKKEVKKLRKGIPVPVLIQRRGNPLFLALKVSK
uniref:Probable periplasmic serine endoprotease DegP-like n=1 Tax=Candidatus Kentrum sp. MB TaxID=2138164 RepID=A0A450XTL9_9GAMM|nr:MAG: serine protease Do [Candidatus Kentron sp. MB]VFK32640.1 MAG: serine protease Do [Candidatus Kentron sp. MB]VFK76009.1 MAG: serine protease Do [Candidatus Kentron sp. MB]